MPSPIRQTGAPICRNFSVNFKYYKDKHMNTKTNAQIHTITNLSPICKPFTTRVQNCLAQFCFSTFPSFTAAWYLLEPRAFNWYQSVTSTDMQLKHSNPIFFALSVSCKTRYRMSKPKPPYFANLSCPEHICSGEVMIIL